MPFVKITPRPMQDVVKWKIGQSYTGALREKEIVERKFGQCMVYSFETEYSPHFANYTSLYGFFNLDCLMKNVKYGEIVRITYLGLIDKAHQASVEVWESNFKGK